MSKYIKVKQATKQGYIICPSGGVADLSYPTSKLRRGRVQGGGMVAPTITTSPGVCKVYMESGGVRARRLTAREIGRLMGVSDGDISTMMEVNPDSRLITQFGNSIVVQVLEAIFRQLNIRGVKTWTEINQDAEIANTL
ncbi:MAG: DNA cytosine methyltransferase [Lachnospiraceae bacterium]|nr:DNA cytosine methyltransferase [Lachnospiraceae bacterium]